MEVHGRLGPAGGAGGEGEQGDVVGGRRRRRRRCRPWRRARGVEVVVRAAVATVRRLSRPAATRSSTKRWSHSARSGSADLAIVRSSPGAQQRHRGHHDATGLEHAEPAGHQPAGCSGPQQHPVAGHQAEVLDEHLGDLVGRGGAGRRRSRVSSGDSRQGRSGAVLGDDVVEQGGRAVEPVGVVQLRQVEEQLGPLVERRQVVAAEGVDVRRRRELHARRQYSLAVTAVKGTLPR